MSFVTPFAKTTRLLAWGYCGGQMPAPPRDVLELLEQAALAGDRAALRKNVVGLYKPEDDDCCDFYEGRQ